jgi:hypothetical protein
MANQKEDEKEQTQDISPQQPVVAPPNQNPQMMAPQPDYLGGPKSPYGAVKDSDFVQNIQRGLAMDKNVYQTIGNVLQAPKHLGENIAHAIPPSRDSRLPYPGFAEQPVKVNPNQYPVPNQNPMLPAASPDTQKLLQDVDQIQDAYAGGSKGYELSPQEQAHRAAWMKSLPPPVPETKVQIGGGGPPQTPGEQLEKRIRSELPGANDQQVQHLMMQVAQHKLIAEAQRAAQHPATPDTPEKMVYHTVNPGQTLTETSRTGTKEIYRAQPKEDNSASHKKDNAQVMQPESHISDAMYRKQFDHITQNIPREPHTDPKFHYLTQREKALHDLNTEYAISLGVEPSLAAVHESRELFLKQQLKSGEKDFNDDNRKQKLENHALLIKKRAGIMRETLAKRKASQGNQ